MPLANPAASRLDVAERNQGTEIPIIPDSTTLPQGDLLARLH
jgi:hypothetical protein